MRNDVLIIGAGPSGLFAAAELARHGVEARLIEREVRPHREARATAIQPGTLEILDSVGLLPPFLDAAEHVRCARLYGPDMAELGAMSHDGIDCRCEFQCSLPQYETQRILEAHLASLGGVVERGVTATKVEADADGVLVELVHADGRRGDGPPERRHRRGRGAQRHAPFDERAARGRHLPGAFPRRRHRDAGAVPARRGRRRLRPGWPAAARAAPGRALDQFPGPGRGGGDRIRRRRRRPGPGTARREVSTHRRRLVRAVSDAPADRLAPGGRPAVPDRRRRSPVEPVRRRRAQLGPARRLRPRVEARARPARPCASVAARRLRGGAPDRGPPRPRRLRPGAHFDHRRARTPSGRAARCMPRSWTRSRPRCCATRAP